MKPVYFVIAAFITMLIIFKVFEASYHSPPTCPLCNEPAIKCNVNEGRTMLRCVNNHIWYQ